MLPRELEVPEIRTSPGDGTKSSVAFERHLPNSDSVLGDRDARPADDLWFGLLGKQVMVDRG